MTIRPPERSDAAAFLAAVDRSRSLHHPWVFPAETARAFHAYLRTRKRADQWGVVVCAADDRSLVGVININNIVRGGLCSGALGYYAFAGAENRGLMTEGLTAVLNEAFDPIGLGLHRLEANIQPGNVASQKLVARLGFRHEGFSPRFLFIDGAWRDHDRWAITAEMWDGRFHG